MFLSPWTFFTGYPGSSRRRKLRQRGARRSSPPSVEALEDRTTPSAADVQAALLQSPLYFEPNLGQAAPQVHFLSRGGGSGLFLTSSEAVLSLPGATEADGAVLRMQLVGASPNAPAAGIDLLPGVSNYLVGSDPSAWRTDIPHYAAVGYRGVYDGIDLRYHGAGGRLEYDFLVAPGTDPGRIRLNFTGMEGMSLDAAGNLVLRTAAGQVVEQSPVMYQEVGGVRQAVGGGYVLFGDGEVGFRIGAYDRSLPLVIDPILDYSTYLGGNSAEQGFGIAVDSSGNAYITGDTFSGDFPTTLSAAQGSFGGLRDAFVAKLSSTGSLLYATYLGGSGDDHGYAIAVDGFGNASVTGYTQSSNFPTTAGAFQVGPGGDYDAFVAKLNGTGGLVYSTYLGGSGEDQGYGIAVDGSGSAYVTGSTLYVHFRWSLRY